MNTAERIRLSVDRETGRQKGFAHVDFKSEVLAKRAVNELNGIELMGRPLRIDYAISKNNAPGGAQRPLTGPPSRGFSANENSVFLGV